MSKVRSMYAGSSGYAYGANTHSEGNGNGFLQGLVSTVNKRAGLIKFIRTESGGQNRDMVFCLNQLGGVGKRSNMFASNADGVHQPCQGSDQVLEALGTLYNAFLDGKAGTDDGEVDQSEAQALGISPALFGQILSLFDYDKDESVDKEEVYHGLIRSGGSPKVDLTHGLWLETPGVTSGGDLYDADMRDNTNGEMKSWIAGLKTIIEQQGIDRLVVRLCNITASWAVDITDTNAPLHYWQRVSNDGAMAGGQGEGADIGSKIYSLEKDSASNFHEYSLAWLIKECGITEVLWAPLVSETARFAGPNATGGDIQALFAGSGNYTNYTRPLSDGTDQAKQIYEDTKFMVKCIQKYRDELGKVNVKIKTGILWEVENRGAQWLFCNDRDEREWGGGDVVTFNPIYDMSTQVAKELKLDKNWTFALCPFVIPGKESASAITIASLWASAVDYNIEVFPQWYGMKSFLKSGPGCSASPEFINSGRSDPKTITEKIEDELRDYNDDERAVGNPLSKIDTPFIADLQIEDSIYNYWKGIWGTESQTSDTKSTAPIENDYFAKIIQLVPTLKSNRPPIPVPPNFKYTALVSIESFFFGGGCNGFPIPWSFDQIDGFSQEVANIVGWGTQFNTMYFQASYLFPGANNLTTGPDPQNAIIPCGTDPSCP